MHLRVHIYDILYFFILNKLVADRFKKFKKTLQKIISTSENNKKNLQHLGKSKRNF